MYDFIVFKVCLMNVFNVSKCFHDLMNGFDERFNNNSIQ